jgi:hypothetical protein
MAPGASHEPRPNSMRKQKRRCQPRTRAAVVCTVSMAGFHISDP